MLRYRRNPSSEHDRKETAYETKTTRNASHGLASSRLAIVCLHGLAVLKVKTRSTFACLRSSMTALCKSHTNSTDFCLAASTFIRHAVSMLVVFVYG